MWSLGAIETTESAVKIDAGRLLLRPGQQFTVAQGGPFELERGLNFVAGQMMAQRDRDSVIEQDAHVRGVPSRQLGACGRRRRRKERARHGSLS
jgi:hypothetical protein